MSFIPLLDLLDYAFFQSFSAISHAHTWYSKLITFMLLIALIYLLWLSHLIPFAFLNTHSRGHGDCI